MDDEQKETTRGKDLSDFIRGRIFALKFDIGWSYNQIAYHLKMSRNTIAKVCQRMNLDEPKKRGRENCGSSKSTNTRDERLMVRLSEQNRFLTAVQLQEQSFPDISVHTVRRRLVDHGLKAFKPAKKPKLNDRLMDLRKNWATSHRNWTNEDWNMLAFSDESSFSLSTTSVQYVRRRIGERYDGRCIEDKENRSRGHCMVWGAFSIHGFTPLHRVENGSLTAERYQNLLEEALIPHLQILLPNGGQFQQDNAPAHAANSTRQFMMDKGINVFPWPSTSPDMNPIENAWGHMENILKRDYERPASSDELYETLVEIWNEIMTGDNYRIHLISSMTNRVRTLFEVDGGYTKY